jgi:hypothetical protein
MALTPRPSLVSRTVPAKSEIAPYPVDAILAMSAAGSIARVTSPTRIIRSTAGHRRDQRDLVPRTNDLIVGGELSIDRYARRIRKDRGTGKKSQVIDEISNCAAGFEREFESRAAEALGV